MNLPETTPEDAGLTAPGPPSAAERGLRELARNLMDADQLHELEALRELQDALSDALGAAVLDARREGLTWALIGGLLGVSEQAAQQRFAKLERGDETVGMSAAQAARAKGVNRSTIQRNPERYGFEKIQSTPPGPPRYRPIK